MKETLILRQIHALEHATVWVLSESGRERTSVQVDNELLGGLSTNQGFCLYGEVNIGNLRRAVALAKHRLTSGEWDLAVHPRCGTNASAAILLTVGLAISLHLLLPFRPIEQLMGLGLAATTASELAPDVGAIAQRYLTTAIPNNIPEILEKFKHIKTFVDNWEHQIEQAANNSTKDKPSPRYDKAMVMLSELKKYLGE